MDSAMHKSWIWCWRPEGIVDAGWLDPDQYPQDPAEFSWGSCGREARAGDLVALYQAAPVKAITHFLQVVSDAHPSPDAPALADQSYRFVALYRPLAALKTPIPLSELRADTVLRQLGAVRASFRGTQFAVSRQQWRRLIAHADHREHGVGATLKAPSPPPKAFRAGTEKELGDHLVRRDLQDFRRVGLDLRLKESGRERHAPRHGGRMDLFCEDRSTLATVIIELKNRDATERDVGQLASYVAWAEESEGGDVIGVLVAQSLTVGGRWALQALPFLRFVAVPELLGRFFNNDMHTHNEQGQLTPVGTMRELDRLRPAFRRLGADFQRIASVIGDTLADGVLYQQEVYRLDEAVVSARATTARLEETYDDWIQRALVIPTEPDE